MKRGVTKFWGPCPNDVFRNEDEVTVTEGKGYLPIILFHSKEGERKRNEKIEVNIEGTGSEDEKGVRLIHRGSGEDVKRGVREKFKQEVPQAQATLIENPV